MTDHSEIDRRHRHGDHRPRMGRHQGTEHAAAALVAVHILRHHHLGDRLLGRLSGLAADVRATPPACSATRSRADVAVELADLEKIRGDEDGQRSARRRSPTSRRIRRCWRFARARGKAAFGDNCAPCHGSGGAGAKGYPNLNDDDWLWGGTLDQIQQTIQFGARSGHAKAHEGADAGLRQGRHAQAATRSSRSPTMCARCRACRPARASTLPPARRSSPTIARPATATPARATRSSARPT